jgi:glycosyltransferase involved in cell wall biosynthesis
MPSVEASDGDNEGLPIVALEAQAAGLPIVAFDQGPIPEAIEANVTGLLAKARSAESLAECLKRLIDDPALRLRMGQSGRERVEQHFDLQKRSMELEQIYGALCRQRSRASQALAAPEMRVVPQSLTSKGDFASSHAANSHPS